MAKPILVANWKNHPSSLLEAQKLLKDLGKLRLLYKKLSLFIAPPLPYMESVASKAKGFAHLASQDLFIDKGTYTGETTLEVLRSFGVKLAILGHSERRALGETSEMVAKKVQAALKAGIVPLVCIGEKTHDADGEHFEYIRNELKVSLGNLTKQSAAKIVVAYEPAWAIGKTAVDALPPAELAQSVVFLKKVLADLYGRSVAEKIPILYGGSVEPDNAGELMRNTSVRGFLVGHASINHRSFESIARAIIEK